MSSGPRRRGPLMRFLASPAGSWYFLHVANPIDRWLVPATNGRLSSAPGQQVCVVETIGVKSGMRRRIPLHYATDGDDLVLIASAGGAARHPAWFHNLRAHPDVRVTANKGRSGDYHARVTSGKERERKWRRAVELYPGYEAYQQRAGERRIPVIALTPR